MIAAYEAAWERDRVGSLAEVLRERLPQVVRERHDLSVDAHVAAGVRSGYTYGAAQYSGLMEDLAALAVDVPGLVVRAVEDARSVLVVEQTGTVIYPFRYGRSRRRTREQARMPQLSEVRRMFFLQDTLPMGDQLTLEQGQLTAAELADLEAEVTDLRAAGRVGVRVVVLGYASDVSGVWGIGWGELEVRDSRTGELHWPVWIALDTAVAEVEPDVGPLRAVHDAPVSGPVFDDGGTPADTGFGLEIRPDSAGSDPADQPAEPRPETGTDSAEPGR